MRLLAIILAFYSLALSLVPCNDVHADEHGSTVIHKNADDHEEHNDVCTPFCQCSCCQSFVDLLQIKPFKPTAFIPNINFSNYIEESLPLLSVDHWQPPKIS